VEFKLGFSVDSQFTICCDGKDWTFWGSKRTNSWESHDLLLLRVSQHQVFGLANHYIFVPDHGIFLIAYAFMVCDDMLFQSFRGLWYEKSLLPVNTTLCPRVSHKETVPLSDISYVFAK
jgi:hypothetical protein